MTEPVLPQVISGQFVEQGKLSYLQGIQPASSLHFLRDSRVHGSLLWGETLGRLLL